MADGVKSNKDSYWVIGYQTKMAATAIDTLSFLKHFCPFSC